MNFFYKISVDRVTPNYISGWCFKRLNKREDVDLVVQQGRLRVGLVKTGLYREDLYKLGLHPSGNCGFEAILDESLIYQNNIPITVRVKKTGAVLVSIPSISKKTVCSGGARLNLTNPLSLFMGKNLPICFMHIPKTAGTSFNTLAYSLFNKKKVITHIELTSETERQTVIKNKQFISGHLHFNVLNDLYVNKNVLFYSIVREPFAQLHSHIKWLIQTSSNSTDNFFRYSNPVLYDFGIELGKIDFSAIKQVVRFSEQISGIGAAFFDNIQTRYFGDIPDWQRVDGKILSRAIDNTKQFKYIGLTERYGDFVELFVKQAGCRKPFVSPSMNRSLSAPLFDIENEHIREALLPLVQYDLKLYDHISEYSYTTTR